MSESLSISESKALIILGMHRSGTSALTRVLNLMGVNLGTRLLEAGPGNELGFWEHKDVLQIHEELLAELDMSWHDVRPLPDDWANSQAACTARKKITAVIERDFSQVPVWGVKDPRLCRFLPLWLSILQELGVKPHFMVLFRHPIEVSASIEKRDGIALQSAIVLWLRYGLELERFSRGYPRAFTTYQQFLRSWEITLEHALKLLQLDLNEPKHHVQEIQDFLQPSMRHHDAANLVSESPTESSNQICSFYVQLAEMCNSQAEDSEFVQLFDRFSAGLLQADQWYAPILTSQNVELKEAIKHSAAAHAAIIRFEARINELEHELDGLRQDKHRLETALASIQTSTSWRITRPLRYLRTVTKPQQ